MSKLTPSEIKELASCLRLRVDSPGADCSRVRYAIDHIPHHLRASKMINLFVKAGLFNKLCCVHEGLDSSTVSSIFDSLRAEVIDSVQSLRQYAYLLGPDENMALDRTAGIEGMWRESIDKDRSTHSMHWKYQADQCQACMLSRVASKPAVLRELRTLILGKVTSTGSTILILSFINEWIMLTDQKDELFYLSGQRAAVIKNAKQEWRKMKAMTEHHNTQQQRVSSHKAHILTERILENSKPRPSVASLSRPPSRNAHEFAEIESILRSYGSDIETDASHLPPSEESYSSSTISDYSHGDSMTTMNSLHNEGNISDHFHPDGALSYCMHGPWPSTEGLQDPRPRVSVTPDSSAGTLVTSFVTYPEFHGLHRSSESEAELPNRLTIPPLRSHSPFAVPHLIPSRRPSMSSPYRSVPGLNTTAQDRQWPESR
ncbi:hypothetical protein UA08_08740 [Talaromyces atroroseus]|uniref:Uncharacterized protein n=1 Tax=Talaromyces atroroseus TaxID=1441469 RepID=A0A225ARR9_TALAT|nr:hypothetical protein UA08_08740 [Talaromyces atroroseus]OKL56137.1 hypothetical protein UA08_08740 [Talaromyces atroroseus]